MDIDKPIQLRPRFKLYSSLDKSVLISKMKKLQQKYKNNYRFDFSGNHIFIHHLKRYEKMYTPHLHLELIENEKDDKGENHNLLIKGLYSPNSNHWTLFMFLHFFLAIIFIALIIIAYTQSVLKSPYDIYLYMLLVVSLIWIVLYVFARFNRKRGLSQAYDLEKIYKEWIIEN